MMVAGGWWLVRASMSIQQHGARQSCTLWALDTRHTCRLGQSDEYWNCIGYKILDKLCCGKCWIDPLKLPNYPEWWLGPVAGCWVHSVQVCRPSVGVRGRYSLVLGWLGWAGLGWAGLGTGSGVYIHSHSLFRLHLHRLAAPPTTSHHWRQSCLNKTRIS